MTECGDRVALGRLNGAWGTGGWIKVFSFTDPPERIFDYQPWRTTGPPGLVHVRQWRRQGPRLVAEIVEIEDRNAAEALHGVSLYIERERLPRVGEGAYYWHDLIGLEVFNRDGERLGEVGGLLDAGVHDVLAIQRPGGGSDVLVPFVKGHFVDEVDLAAGRITVDWRFEWTDAD